MSVAPGMRLSHYEVIAPLGEGGMGQVYQARDTQLDRNVALKFLTDERTHDKSAVERFIREARAASALNHPNIVTIYEVGEAAAGRYIVMELVQGQTLRAAAGGLTMDAIVKIAAQIAKALVAAHAAGIAHRDIKPENVMVRPDGYVKVLDFGLARLLPSALTDPSLDTTAETGPGIILGTVRYMSPEQARGEAAGAAADIFSLGVLLYEMSTGYHPFLANSPIGILNAILTRPPVGPSKLNPEIPAWLEQLILAMLEKDFRLRPSAVEVEARLTGASSSRPATPARTIVALQRHTVGRDRERLNLSSAFEECQRRGMLVCVTGEAGLGKTTLVEDFLSQLPVDGVAHNAARGRSSERLAGTDAYLPFIEALDSLLQGENRDTVARLLKLLAPTWYMQIVPVGTDDASAARRAADIKSGSQERMKRELATFLQELADQQPLIMFLEDVHWADASTVDLIAYLGARFDAIHMLLVVTYRPSELQATSHPFLALKLELQGRGLCREIAVGFLNLQDVERYLALEFPEHDFPATLAGIIHQRTEGNALFMCDLVNDLRSRKVLNRDTGRWRLQGSAEKVARELPESVRSMIRRKIDALSDEDRRLLLAGSVEGYEFNSSVVARATGIAPTLVEERLDVLERVHAFVRFVSEREFADGTPTLRYRFVHVLYQNALYESLRATRRATLSGAVAGALVAFYKERSGEVASELALLFEAARDHPNAARYFLMAAQNTIKIFAHGETAVLARRGLELLKAVPEGTERAGLELQLLLALGASVTASKGYAAPELLQTYSRARELCQSLGDQLQLIPVLHGLYRYHLVRGEIQTAHDVVDRLLSLAEHFREPILLRVANGATGVPLLHLGEFELARDHFDRCIEGYDPEQFRSYTLLHGADPGMAAQLWSALTLWLLGESGQAEARSRNALEMARSLGYPFGIAYALSLTAWFHQLRREPELVEQHAAAALALSTEQGFGQWLALARMFGAWARTQRGITSGVTDLVEGIASFRNTSAELNLPHFLSLLADAHLATSQPDEGLLVVDQALEVAHRNHDRYWEAELYRLEGELRQMRGDPAAQVEECFRQSIDVARQQRALSLQLRSLVSLSQMLRKSGRQEEVRADLAAAREAVKDGQQTADLKNAEAELKRAAAS